MMLGIGVLVGCLGCYLLKLAGIALVRLIVPGA